MLSCVCAYCGRGFVYEKRGRGPNRKFCEDCRDSYGRLSRDERRERNLARRRLTCAWCGELMFCAPTSRPQGEAMHNACQRNLTQLRHRHRAAIRTQSPKLRPVGGRKATNTERGYGWPHVRARKQLLSEFVLGTLCALCGEPMTSDMDLDLDHSDPASRLRGEPGDRLTHSVCNRRDGAHRARPPRPPRLCEICGDTYKPKYGRQRACSRVCGAEIQRRNRELKEVS